MREQSPAREDCSGRLSYHTGAQLLCSMQMNPFMSMNAALEGAVGDRAAAAVSDDRSSQNSEASFAKNYCHRKPAARAAAGCHTEAYYHRKPAPMTSRWSLSAPCAPGLRPRAEQSGWDHTGARSAFCPHHGRAGAAQIRVHQDQRPGQRPEPARQQWQ